jgi:hypothetical protein
MTFEDIMARFARNSHFSVIHRRGYRECGEFGFRTMGAGADYFLWIITSVEDLVRLTGVYHLPVLV